MYAPKASTYLSKQLPWKLCQHPLHVARQILTVHDARILAGYDTCLWKQCNESQVLCDCSIPIDSRQIQSTFDSVGFLVGDGLHNQILDFLLAQE